MNSTTMRPLAAVLLGLGAAGTVLAGGTAEALVTIESADVAPGDVAMVGVAIEVDDLIGSFVFDIEAGGLTVVDVVYDGPLFSLGWDGWDTAPSMTPNVSAACIFPEDQVTGFQELFTLAIEIPEDTAIGTTYDIVMPNAHVTNYAFQEFDVLVTAGVITVVDDCPADIAHADGTVDTADLLALLGAWGSTDPEMDVNGDGVVDTSDLVALLAAWGPCP